MAILATPLLLPLPPREIHTADMPWAADVDALENEEFDKDISKRTEKNVHLHSSPKNKIEFFIPSVYMSTMLQLPNTFEKI